MKSSITLLLLLALQITATAQMLIPQPKSISLGNSTCTLASPLTVHLGPEAGTETRFSLSNLAEELSLKSIRVSETGNSSKTRLVMGIIGRDRAVDREMAARNLSLPPEARGEGYLLSAFADRILVAAHTEAGLFYGIQTLKQLIRTSEDKQLPELTIVDWPSMRYRGWMDDISRGPIPTVDFLKRCIREMASYKQNYFTLYTEHVFRLEAFADIAPADGLTAAEVQELTAYAAQYHMEVVGNLQSFGHMAKMLAIPFYAHLGENADILNPADEAVYDFLERAYAEIVPAYKSSFFNINCDETFGLGEGRSKALAAEIGVDGMYARHINRIDSLLKPYGKRIMMWGDIAVNNPGIISRLPKDLVILSWGYHAAESFDDAILPFKNTGFDFMVAPGVSCWNELWPGLSNAVINIANYTRDGHKLGALGMMNTAWDDNGHNLFNSNWHGLLWGAECSWAPLHASPGEMPDAKERLAAFNSAFDKLFLQADGLTELFFAIDSLRNYPVPGILNEWAFWNDITEFNAANTSPEFLEKNRAILSAATELSAKLNQFGKFGSIPSTGTDGSREINRHQVMADNAVLAQHLEMADNAALALQRIAFTAQKNIVRVMLFNAKNTGPGDGALLRDIRLRLDSLKRQLYGIKKQYITLWQRENRSWWLDKNLNDYNKLSTNIDEAGHRILMESATATGGGLQIRMQSVFGESPIVYTLDGTEPGINSPVYTESSKDTKGSTGLLLSNSALVKARVFIPAEPTSGMPAYLGPVTEKHFTVHKGIGTLKELHSAYSNYNPAYAAGGKSGLLDGLTGSQSFSDGRWQGYQGQDLDIELDLKAVTPVKSIAVNFLQHAFAWILLPKDLELQASDDGTTYRTVRILSHNHPPSGNDPFVHTFTFAPASLQTRYLRIIAHNPGPLPSGHQAAGYPSYIFADEIIVY